MGVADVIPGVSGGTIAFISGIYEELVHSINELDSTSIRLLSKFQFATFWKKINGNFLATVLGGVSTSLLLLSGVMWYLLKYYPIMTWSFFFGLILMSFPLILRKIKKWKAGSVTGFLLGIVLTYLVTISSPVQSPDNVLIAFLAGATASCALVVPGVSGVFILLLIGKYQYVATALNEVNIFVIFVFTIGCLAGLIGASRLLTWALANYHQVVIALLSGFMLGALNKVWPWRKVLEYATNSKGDQIAVFDKSVLPWDYLSETGKDPQLFQAIFMMALGVLMVVLIEKIAVRLKTKH